MVESNPIETVLRRLLLEPRPKEDKNALRTAETTLESLSGLLPKEAALSLSLDLAIPAGSPPQGRDLERFFEVWALLSTLERLLALVLMRKRRVLPIDVGVALSEAAHEANTASSRVQRALQRESAAGWSIDYDLNSGFFRLSRGGEPVSYHTTPAGAEEAAARVGMAE